MPPPKDLPMLGNRFDKPDLERIGLFMEMPYLPGKIPRPSKKPSEGRNLLCEGRKTKNGTQHGYFEDTFKRVFSKEALRGRGRKPAPSKFKNMSERPFVPPSGFKLHSTPGDYYGTFSGIIEAFGAKAKTKPPYKPELKNCITNPGRKGSYGYADTCLNKYPEHLPDRYGLKLKYKEYGKNLGRAMVNIHFPQPYFDKNPYKEPEKMKPGPTYVRPKTKVYGKDVGPGLVPTGPAKWQGGSHAGCFNAFPEHMPDRYKPPDKSKKVPNLAGNWWPQSMALKSYFNTSVVNQNVDFRVNEDNFKTFEPSYTKYLLPATNT